MKDIKILLAEDDQLLAALLNFGLAKAGYNVHHAVDGKEVKEYLSKTVPDIIVSDIMMPYYSGIELVHHIRQELFLDVPIFIFSSADNEENVHSSYEQGATDFLSKPVNPSELLQKIHNQVNKISID